MPSLPVRQRHLSILHHRRHHDVAAKSPNAFEDPGVVDAYADRVAQNVPAYRDMHRMASVLIDEHAPPDARILVLGAGGGLEAKAFAGAHPGWTFDAVDPAAVMLDLAVQTLGPSAHECECTRGTSAMHPPGPSTLRRAC
ncbi:MAG: tRNA (cmo5U34)-methyltransferase [Mycobacterium sp.]|nr:tRNA (cmo5U34)-methyltransferase [Mycobacterium sp.]